MEFSTLTGLLATIAVFLVALIWHGDYRHIIDFISVVIVLGGSISVTLIRFSFKQCFQALKNISLLFKKVDDNYRDLMITILTLSQKSRKDGLLSLETIPVHNEFLKQGLQHIIDGLDAQLVQNILTKEMLVSVDAKIKHQQVFRGFGEAAPAMGMIGTLFGLVQMLANLNNPESIGPAMAIAMLTTLYGALLAHAFALPISEKFSQLASHEMIMKSMIIEALLSIQKKQNPRIIYNILKSYLPNKNAAQVKAKIQQKISGLV